MSEAHRSSEMRDAVCPACSCLCDDIEMGRDPSGEPVLNMFAVKAGHSLRRPAGIRQRFIMLVPIQ